MLRESIEEQEERLAEALAGINDQYRQRLCHEQRARIDKLIAYTDAQERSMLALRDAE